MPSELRSKPRIPRTPAEGDVRDSKKQDQDMPQFNQDVPVKIKGEVVNDPQKLTEHKTGFISHEKIPRTPPDQNV